MSSSERTGLIASSGNESDPTGLSSTNSPKDNSSGTNSSTRLAIFIAYLGAFLASSDESVVIATYDVIASEFHELAKGHGYSISAAMTGLIAGRIVSGVGAACMAITISIIITDLAAPRDVALLRSYTNVVAMIGRGVGAPIGSIVVNSLGWRWAFAGRLPLIVLCLVVSQVYFPDHHKETAEPQTSHGGNIKQLDYLGIATFATAVVALLMAITITGQEGGKMSHLYFWLVIFTLAAIFFTLHEILWPKRPLVPLKLATKGIGQYWLVELLIFSGRNGRVATITQYLAQVKRLPEATASMYLVLCTMGLAVGSMTSGFAIQRTKRYRTRSLYSAVISILSSILLFFAWHFRPSGRGVFVGDSHDRAPPEVLASSIGAYYLSQQLGLIVGAAMGPLVVRTGFKHDIAGRLNESVIRNVLRDAKYVDTLPEDIQRVVRSSLGYGYQFVPVLATVTVALCVPSLVLTREQSVE
ncbi:MFS general substrate transporter [Aspergillus aculeatinus CBS 121060]|uniref:MFS general substrate transporter n=1 Tax=Aspergillus aculeatinus CBS 121060 TaxID=1448322 RepID=A0ACD1H5N0_9EURO|nr:MFS general substrate transporter [Aspergillus aculeatinus CBS 121060]RAH68922.1 MFS general substrate transporter [Aspergillus aculeatinus CBS 121060]